ncbi:MAG: sulfur carrier protein ThiS [Fusobacteriota bacterium]
MKKIKINGKYVTVKHDTILEYIRSKNLNSKKIIIEHNSNIIKEKLWSETLIRDGDKLEILNFVGGG